MVGDRPWRAWKALSASTQVGGVQRGGTQPCRCAATSLSLGPVAAASSCWRRSRAVRRFAFARSSAASRPRPRRYSWARESSGAASCGRPDRLKGTAGGLETGGPCLSRGFRGFGISEVFVGARPATLSDLSGHRADIEPLDLLDMTEPMLAKLAGQLPRQDACPGGCLYEPKWDGFRAITRVDERGDSTLSSRRSKPLSAAFPEIAAAAASILPASTTVDGEIVRWSSEGRLEFSALQRRLHAGRSAKELARLEPCHYVIFDLLNLRGEDFRERPLSERRAALERLLAEVPGRSALVLGLQTGDLDQAREWFDSLAAVGIEGLIVKAARQPYRPGGRDWVKIKHYTTTEVIIGGLTGTLVRPQGLIVGRYRSATGELMVVGRSTILGEVAAAEVARAVRPASEEHPWPDVLPPGWTSSIYGSREPTRYTRLIPDLVLEVRVDVATDHHRWRHPVRYMRLRPDLTADEVPRDLELDA